MILLEVAELDISKALKIKLICVIGSRITLFILKQNLNLFPFPT